MTTSDDPFLQRLFPWVRGARADFALQLKLMESGEMRTGEDHGMGMKDTTAKSIERVRQQIADLDELLADGGAQEGGWYDLSNF